MRDGPAARASSIRRASSTELQRREPPRNHARVPELTSPRLRAARPHQGDVSGLRGRSKNRLNALEQASARSLSASARRYGAARSRERTTLRSFLARKGSIQVVRPASSPTSGRSVFPSPSDEMGISAPFAIVLNERTHVSNPETSACANRRSRRQGLFRGEPPAATCVMEDTCRMPMRALPAHLARAGMSTACWLSASSSPPLTPDYAAAGPLSPLREGARPRRPLRGERGVQVALRRVRFGLRSLLSCVALASVPPCFAALGESPRRSFVWSARWRPSSRDNVDVCSTGTTRHLRARRQRAAILPFFNRGRARRALPLIAGSQRRVG